MTSWYWYTVYICSFFEIKRLLDTLDNLVIAFIYVSECLPLSAGGERALDGQMGGFEPNNLVLIFAVSVARGVGFTMQDRGMSFPNISVSPSRILSQMQWRLLAWIRPLLTTSMPLAAMWGFTNWLLLSWFHIVSVGIRDKSWLSQKRGGDWHSKLGSADRSGVGPGSCGLQMCSASPDANTTSLDRHSVALLHVWERGRFCADPVNHRLLQKSLTSSCVRSESSGCSQCLSSIVVPKFSTNSLSSKWLPLGSLQVVLAWKERCETSFLEILSLRVTPRSRSTAKWIVRNTDYDILKAAFKFNFSRQSLQWLGDLVHSFGSKISSVFFLALFTRFFVRSLDAFLAYHFGHGVSEMKNWVICNRLVEVQADQCGAYPGWDCQDLHTYFAWWMVI